MCEVVLPEAVVYHFTALRVDSEVAFIEYGWAPSERDLRGSHRGNLRHLCVGPYSRALTPWGELVPCARPLHVRSSRLDVVAGLALVDPEGAVSGTATRDRILVW